MAEKKTLTILEKLNAIQVELKAPKNLYNSFGKYHYRNAEGIQEALKPLEKAYGVITILSDTIEEVGGRVYVKSTAILTDVGTGENVTVHAYAREALEKKGMDETQITGATSSYARKYALNGLFLLDDTKDVDTEEYQSQVKAEPKTERPLTQEELLFLSQRYTGENLEKLLDYYKIGDISEIDPKVARNLINQIKAKAKKGGS